MSDNDKHCVLCKMDTVEDVYPTRDYFFSNESFCIRHCNSCGVRYTHPQPNEVEIAKYYRTENYYSHQSQPKGIFSMVYQWVRHFNTRYKAKLIHGVSPDKGSLLDVGCGSGAFLSVMKKAGWNCTGVEINENARQYVQKTLGIDVHNSVDNTPQTAHPFDVITLWHVLEHFHNPGAVLHQLHKRLKQNGTLILAVPNYESRDAKWFKSYWAAYDVPRHLYHFNIQSITGILRQYNFDVIEKRSVFPDVFYISFLSAKYKRIVCPLLYGLVAGLFFSLRTRLPDEASSVIFVAKKMK